MILKRSRAIFICIILFGLTSSCEDKDRQSFGTVNLTFNYQDSIEPTNLSTNNVTQNRTSHSTSSKDEINREKGFIKNRELLETSIEINEIESINENLVEDNITLLQDYRYARITLNGDAIVLDLTSQTNYSKTIPIGQAQILVELYSSADLILYNSIKNIQVEEDATTTVTFLSSDWVPVNQSIEITSDFNSSYKKGDDIPVTWTNTHTARGVKIQMIQYTTTNIIQEVESNYIGNTYLFDSSNEEVKANIGFRITSELNDAKYSSKCCFSITENNSPPTVNNVNETTNEDEPVEIQLDGNDEDGDNLIYTIVSNPAFGTLGSINGNTVLYSPNNNYNGSDSFRYEATDGTYTSSDAQVSIEINAINDAPTTNDVSTTIDENRFARIADLTLDGDDVDGDNLTYILTSNPSNGSASINGNILTYNANQDWNGEETFSYKANDGQLDSNVSTITITVNPVNDNPVVSNPANSKALNGEHDYINLGPVINFNSNNPNSTPPGLGSWTLIFNAKVDQLDDNGRAAILSSGTNATNQGVFFGIYTIPIDGGTPRLSLDFYQVDNLASDDVSSIIGDGLFHSFAVTYSGSSAKLFLDGVKVAENSFAGNYGNNDKDLLLGLSPWNNFNDLNGYLNYGAIWTGEHSEEDILDMHNGTENPGDHPTNLQGWWDFNSNTSFEDLSTNNFTASYATNGTQGDDEEANITLNEDSSIDIDLQSYVYDVDDDALTYTIVNQPENGTLTFISDSEIRYEPADNYNGLDEFSWKVNDGVVDSNTSTINIEVISVNDPPTTDGGKTYSTPYDTALDIVLSGEDVDGDNLTYSVTETSTSGSATIEISNNIATITPTTTNSVNTKISFKYQVSDGNLNSEETTVAIWLIGNEFTNPTSSSEWMVGTTETIAWTRGPDFDTSSGLFLVKDGDYENRITIVNPIPTQGSNLVNSYDYVIPNDLELSNDYQVLIAQATNDFPDGQYHYSETFAISASTITKSYTLDSTDGISPNNYFEYTINVPDQGRLLDANFTLSINGSWNNHLRYMNLLLISPNKSRILLAGGDQQSVECSPTGGCISSDANTFTNTTFDDEATTNIHAGSPPYIGSFLPNQPLSTFDDEEVNGDWTFVVINHASASVNAPDLELTLTYDPNLGGSTYQEENNFIFSPSDQSNLTVPANSTGIITIPVSLTGNQAISDLDFELSLSGNWNNHLRYLSVTVDIGNSNNAKLVYRGDQISGTGNAYSRDQASIYKARFDDEASIDYSASLMFNQRVHTIENNALTSFDGKSLNEFRIYVFNSASASLTIDRAKTKLFLDVSSSTGNNAPVTNDVSSKGYIEDGSLDIALDGTDDDGNNLTYSIVSNPSNGTVNINNNIATYTPVNFSGADSFTYKANDGTEDSNVSTVNVGIYNYGKNSIYFTRDLSQGIEKSWLNLRDSTKYDGNCNNEYYGITLSMWIKPESQINSRAALFSRWGDLNNYWSIMLSDSGQLFFENKYAGSYSEKNLISYDESLIDMSGNVWTHIAIRIVSQGINNLNFRARAYINGVDQDEWYYPSSNSGFYVSQSTNNILFGLQRSDQSNTQYIGSIDDILIFNERCAGTESLATISGSQVQEIYNNGYNMFNIVDYFNGAYTIPSYFKLNEGSGNPGNSDNTNGASMDIMDGATWVTE